MKPLHFLPACSVICLLAFSVSPPIASGQQANLTAEKRASLIAERDAIGNDAMAAANAGQLEDAGEKMAQVYEIERALFGDVDAELMGTLSWQAGLAQAAKKWDQEIDFRKRAFAMAQELYGKEDYRSLDLQRELKESQANASRTTEQRRKIAQASKLNDEVVSLYQKRRCVDAIKLATQVKNLREESLGKEHPDYADCLNSLAGLYRLTGDYTQAEPLFLEAKAIREKVLGKEHPDYATSLNDLAGLYRSTGDYAKAIPLLLEAKEVIKQTLGKKHPDYLNCLNSLALMHRTGSTRDYAKAIPFELEAKEVIEQTLGKQHPDYAYQLGSFVGLYRSTGDYAKAIPLMLELKAIEEKVLGKEHPDYAKSLNSLAGLYRLTGDYTQAEPLFLEAKAIREKVLGKEHPDYATSLNDLAGLYASMGDYAKAIPLLLEAKEVIKQTLGKKHPDYLNCLNSLAFMHRTGSTRDYAKAIPFELEAKEVIEQTLGKQHPDYAYQLGSFVGLYRSTGDYAKAIPLMLELKAIEEKVLGKEHPDYAKSLNSLAGLYRLTGDYTQAEPLFLEAKAIREKVLGKEHPDYATSLNDLAGLYRSTGDYAKAIPLLLEAKEVIKQTLGKKHPDYLNCLNSLADMYAFVGEYAKQEPLLLEAKEVAEQIFGEQHLAYATSLNKLASFYSRRDYPRAKLLYLEAIAILEKRPGKKHYQYIYSLNSLALIYASMGDYPRAESLYLEAKEVSEQTLGKQNPSYAQILNSLAGLYASMGDFPRTEPLYVEAIAISRKNNWNKHALLASLHNLVGVYRLTGEHAKAEPLLLEINAIQEQTRGKQTLGLSMLAQTYVCLGEYAKAEPLLLEAKEITEQTLGKQAPSYADRLNALASLYRLKGDFPRVEQLYLEAKEIREKTLGKQHPDYATSLNNLALIYDSMGDYPRAEPLYLEAKAIREKTRGKLNPSHADFLNSLAGLYASMGDFPRAEPLYLEAKAIREQTLGKQHPDYAATLNNLAVLHNSTGDYARAEPLFLEAVEITINHLEQTSLIQSEQQQMLMLRSVRYQLDNYLSCCLEGGLGQRNAVAQIVDWKGSILVRQRGLRLAADDPSIADQFRQLQSVTSQISAATRSVPDPQQADAWKKRLETLSSTKRDLESELMRLSAPFKEAKQRASFAEFQASIPEGGVVVDYLEYNGKQGRSLLASVIHRDGDPIMLDVGSAEKAGEAIDRWRTSFGMTEEAKQAGKELREQLWDPVLAKIGNAELIIVSTDGVLGRLPMAALPGEKPETYLLEDHRIAFIPVPQLLPALMKNEGGKRLARELLLMGDVDYDAQAGSDNKPDDAKPKRRKRPFERSGLSEEIRGGASWTNLAETGNEVRFIAELYNNLFDPEANAVVDLRKASASETAFRKYAPESMFLHLATHGFFAAPEVKSALSVDQVAKRGEMDRMFAGQQREVIRGHNPGQLSGIVFAGANNPPSIDPRSETATDDGIMTADEIAFLPLNGVRLAVLSACETGLGEVAGGEGLLGIQRGFQVAGTRSTVASLWKVNDAATRRMMQEFYTNYLDKEMSVLDALREAQLWALNNPNDMPRGVRLRKNDAAEVKRLPPQYWAAFTLSGDWR